MFSCTLMLVELKVIRSGVKQARKMRRMHQGESE